MIKLISKKGRGRQRDRERRSEKFTSSGENKLHPNRGEHSNRWNSVLSDKRFGNLMYFLFSIFPSICHFYLAHRIRWQVRNWASNKKKVGPVGESAVHDPAGDDPRDGGVVEEPRADFEAKRPGVPGDGSEIWIDRGCLGGPRVMGGGPWDTFNPEWGPLLPGGDGGGGDGRGSNLVPTLNQGYVGGSTEPFLSWLTLRKRVGSFLLLVNRGGLRVVGLGFYWSFLGKSR